MPAAIIMIQEAAACVALQRVSALAVSYILCCCFCKASQSVFLLLLDSDDFFSSKFGLKTVSLSSISGTHDWPLPDELSDAREDGKLFQGHPWIEPPIRVDYGTNFRLRKRVFLDYNMVIVDTCLVTIGTRTLVGPNCSIYSGLHPLLRSRC